MTFEILFPLYHITSLATAVVFHWAFYTHHLLLQELQIMEVEFFIFMLIFVRFFGLGFFFFFFFFGQFYFLNSSSSHFPYFLNICTASSLAQVSFSFSFSFLIHKSHSPSMLNNLIFSIYISHHQSWGSSSGFTERDVSGWNPETWMDKTYIYFHQTN